MITLSVLTPSYGYGRFIEDALESVRRQKIDLEHIVQDGGSTDSTTTILTARSDVDWVSEPDAGQSDALNQALRRARGEWISWLNADEFYLPGALTTLIAHGTRTGADIVYGDAAFVDAHGAFERLVPAHGFSRFILHNYGTFISTAACIIRKDALPSNPFDASLRLLMDRDVFMKLEQGGGRFRYLPHPVGAFRVHDDRVSAGDETDFSSDREVVTARYGRVSPTSRRLARAAHAALKASSGGYARQRRASRLVGHDLRWFADPRGAETATALQNLYPLVRTSV